MQKIRAQSTAMTSSTLFMQHWLVQSAANTGKAMEE
jgi:hypothetical protein